MRTKDSIDKNFRSSRQTKDGKLSLKLRPCLAKKLTRYCEATNQNRTAFVEMVVGKALSELETEMYERLTKSELIALLKERDMQDALKGQMDLFDL